MSAAELHASCRAVGVELPVKKSTRRPTCPVCRRYADKERDIKGKFYVACYACGYDSRLGPQPFPTS